MLSVLKNKQIAFLFLSSFTVLFTGLGLFPILPLFAAEFQASKSLVGLFLAIIFGANAFAPVAAGWLIARFSKRAVWIAASVMGVPALALLASVKHFTMAIGLTAVLWFSGGVVQALVSILAGLHADAGNRGKVYSLLALTVPFGTLLGGVFVGWLVTLRGYSLMFSMLAVIWSIIPLVGWLGLKEGGTDRVRRTAPARAAVQPEGFHSFGLHFSRLLAFAFLGSLAVNLSRFGASLSMQANGFTAQSVSTVAVASGLATIPFTLLAGTLSDRLGRKHFFGIGLLFALSGALILTGARMVWQYWLAASLNMIAFSVSGAMAQALTSQSVPGRALDRGLARLNAIVAAANILCFAAGGLLFDRLGFPVVFLIAALVALASGMGVEIFIHSGRKEELGPLPEGCVNEK